jgi:hypothetical protein
MGFLFPFATYVSPALAASLLIIIVYEYGVKTGLTLYAAISCLGLMLVPDQELVFMFIFVFGLYSVIKMPLDRKLGKKTRLIAKFAYINISLIISYGILLFIFPVAALVNEFRDYGAGFMALLLAMFWLVFFMYDKAVETVLIIYIRKFRKMFFK